jgi:hypothetical protein
MKEAIFKKSWNIVAIENRDSGEWTRKNDFKRGEWTIDFGEDGKWKEIYHPEKTKQSGRWVYDCRTDIVLTALDAAPEILQPSVFDGNEHEGWLYLCEDASDTPINRKQMITRFAHRRLRLVRDLPAKEPQQG